MLVGSSLSNLDAPGGLADAPRGLTCDLHDLAAAVERGLPKGWTVLSARPEAEELLDVIGHALEIGAERLVVVPLLPQFSRMTTGRLLDTLYRCLGTVTPDLHVEIRSSWFDDSEYITSLADLVKDTMARAEADPSRTKVMLVPGSTLDDDEAYLRHLMHSSRLLAAALGWDEQRVSVVDASLAHSTEVLEAGEPGQELVVLSAGLASHTTDLHLRLAQRLPADRFTLHVCDEAKGREKLAKTLGLLIRRGRHAVNLEKTGGQAAAPVCQRDELIGQLFSVGVSIPGAMACRDGSAPADCNSERFLEVKRPHLEALQLLRDLRSEQGLPECWLFNTCHRFELYSWFPTGMDEAGRAALVERLGTIIGRGRADGVHSVRGQGAWNHLIRTVAGLHSGLVGDADVAEQFETGMRAAEYAGTTGPRSAALVRHITEAVGRLRTQTGWGRFSHRYTEIAMRQLPEPVRARLGHGRITVLGGSTTAASLIEVLRERYHAEPENITVLYRGNRSGPLMNRFLAAVGPDRLKRVEDYHHPSVLDAVADADVAFLAGDHREPVLTGSQIAGARAGIAEPLEIVDFNTFGSIADGLGLGAVRVHDAGLIAEGIQAFNRRTWARADFMAALEEAQAWITRQGGTVSGAAAGVQQEAVAR